MASKGVREFETGVQDGVGEDREMLTWASCVILLAESHIQRLHTRFVYRYFEKSEVRIWDLYARRAEASTHGVNRMLPR
jgi:predicted protein tyrosine phosphatase